MKKIYLFLVSLFSLCIVILPNTNIEANEIPNDIPYVKEGMDMQYGTATPKSDDGEIIGVPYTGDASEWFDDKDGDILTYHISLITPAFENIGDYYIDDSTGQITYTPNSNAAGKTIVFSVSANDNKNTSCLNMVNLTIDVSSIVSENNAELVYDEVTVSSEQTSDLQFFFKSNGNKLVRIKMNDGAVLNNSNYTYTYDSPDRITFKSGFIDNLAYGDTQLELFFDKGQSLKISINKYDDNYEEPFLHTILVYNENNDIYQIDQVRHNDTLNLDIPESSGKGYFVGWFTEPNGKGQKWENGNAVVENLTLYPFWESQNDSCADLKSITISDHTIDIKADTYLYVAPISLLDTNITAVAIPEAEQSSIYWGIVKDGVYICDEAPAQERLFTYKELATDDDVRIVIKIVSPNTSCEQFYSIIFSPQRNNVDVGTLGSEYSYIFKPTIAGLSTSILSNTSVDPFVKFGVYRESTMPEDDLIHSQVSSNAKIYYFDMYLCDADGKELSFENILPAQITLGSALPYTMGKDYSIFFCDGDTIEKQNIVYSGKSRVTFQTSKYGKFALCFTPSNTVQFVSDGTVYYQEDDIEASTINLPEPPQKSGYRFLGWYTQPNGNGSCFDETTIINSNMIVYANWKKIYSGGNLSGSSKENSVENSDDDSSKVSDPADQATADRKIEVSAMHNNINININNMPVTFPDAVPFIDSNSRVQVPIRVIAEFLNFDVNWDEDNRRVTIGNNDDIITLTIGDNIIYKNSASIVMDSPAVILNDRTYIPIRFIGEAFGYEVLWSDYNK